MMGAFYDTGRGATSLDRSAFSPQSHGDTEKKRTAEADLIRRIRRSRSNFKFFAFLCVSVTLW